MLEINQMLLEMAAGNFFYRLKRSSKNDNVEALIVTLNMLAEEIQETIKHQGYTNTNKTTLHIVQMSFILDNVGVIKMTNQQTCNILSMLNANIVEKPFSQLLNENSKASWQHALSTLKQKKIHDTSLELSFITKGNLVIPKHCFITTFQGENEKTRKILITAIHQTNSEDQLANTLKKGVIKFSEKQENQQKNIKTNLKKVKIRLSFEDIRKIRKGHDIIINNLEQDFPSLKDFALQLGTNEFKLKYGFKELYGISVYRFIMQERLRKSKMMVQYSDQSLKSIAHTNGFKSFPHFSRTFKKHFGYSPSELRKKTLNKDK